MKDKLIIRGQILNSQTMLACTSLIAFMHISHYLGEMYYLFAGLITYVVAVGGCLYLDHKYRELEK